MDTSERHTDSNQLRVGIDVGSTTVKAVALDANDTVLAAVYLRHHAHQAETAIRVLEQLAQQMGDTACEKPVRIAVTGSGGGCRMLQNNWKNSSL